MKTKLLPLTILALSLQLPAQNLQTLPEDAPLMSAKSAEVRQKTPSKTLQFNDGKAHISGQIKGLNIAIYTFHAQAGARLEIQNKSANNMEIAVFNPRTGMRLEAPIQLPETGNYELRIVNNRANLEKDPKAYPYQLTLILKTPQ